MREQLDRNFKGIAAAFTGLADESRPTFNSLVPRPSSRVPLLNGVEVADKLFVLQAIKGSVAFPPDDVLQVHHYGSVNRLLCRVVKGEGEDGYRQSTVFALRGMKGDQASSSTFTVKSVS
jgi:hypothetical protein